MIVDRSKGKKIDVRTSIDVDTRRQKVAFLLENNTNITETAIAKELGVHVTTISNDIKFLREQATRFVYDLAKENLCHFYKSTIDDIDRAKQEAWKIYYNNEDKSIRTYDRIKALNTIIVANVKRFELLQLGPSILSMKAIAERLEKIGESRR